MTYDFLAEITQDTHLKRTSSSRGGQYNGPCPWCGGLGSAPLWRSQRYRRECHPMGYTRSQCRRNRPISHSMCVLLSTLRLSTHRHAVHLCLQYTCQGHVKGGVARESPLQGASWRAEHQQAQTLLDLGAGRGSWEAYACRAPVKWLCYDLLIIRNLCIHNESGVPTQR